MIFKKNFDDLKQCVNNKNTGLIYELSIYKSLLSEQDKIIFDSIIKDKVYDIDVVKLLNYISEHNYNVIDMNLVTQDDTVGPSDIILQCNDGKILGLSVKYDNDTIANISAKYFINDELIKKYLKNVIPQKTNEYLTEMKNKYGPPKTFFRKRKKSDVTNEIIDNIRDYVIKEWSIKSYEEKNNIKGNNIVRDFD